MKLESEKIKKRKPWHTKAKNCSAGACPEDEIAQNEEIERKSQWLLGHMLWNLLVHVLHLVPLKVDVRWQEAITVNAYLFSDHQMISLNFSDQKAQSMNPELRIKWPKT